MSEVFIVQPYVPSYRVPFFEGLFADLDASGIRLKIVAGQPDVVQAKRGDSTAPPWLIHADHRVVRALGRSVTVTHTRKFWRNADALIVPHMGSSLDALSALGRKTGLKVGLWGHIASYTTRPNPIDQTIERWQLRRADHVFAYTPSGAQFAQDQGVRSEKITVVMNSVDTSSLLTQMAALADHDVAEFRAEHGIPNTSPLLLFMGGIDASKRIDLLVSALDELDRRNSSVHVLVAGAGAQIGDLERAVQRGQATTVGRLAGTEKAKAIGSSAAFVNPGRIGLIAVESLATGRPILTTSYPFHAPEAEYLKEGISRFTAEEDPVAFADLMESHATLHLPESVQQHPRLDGMIGNFALGVRKLLAA